MTPIFVVLGILAFVGFFAYFQYRLSGRRLWTPLWGAFSMTTAAVVITISGLIGMGDEGAWLRIWLGLVIAALAVLCWWLALRRLRVE